MKIAQIFTGYEIVAAVEEESGYRLIDSHDLSSLLLIATEHEIPLTEVVKTVSFRELITEPELIRPVDPYEVWACGCTYAPSADFRDGELGTRAGMYSYVHKSENRPEIFFKGTERVCVGPNELIGIRYDSTFTAPEPELAIVVDEAGEILAYTLGNDVSAWDIERENALYLPQSKIYDACCSLGPVLVTPDELTDPYNLQMTCTIQRGDQTIFEGSVSTSKLQRKLEDLVDYLICCNQLVTPTVILTGTGIIVEQEAALREGDVCSIHVPEIGTLTNTAMLV